MQKLPQFPFLHATSDDKSRVPDVLKPEWYSQKLDDESEVVYFKGDPGTSHPLAHLAGLFDDEPLWDDFLQAIQEYRQQLNEQEDAD